MEKYVSTAKHDTKKKSRVFIAVKELGSHIDNVTTSLDKLIFKGTHETDKTIYSKRILYSLIALVLLIILGGATSPKGRAEIATFYPTSCLGGWTNVGKATGKGETIDGSPFTDANSAILPANTVADLFCGGFKGDIPDNKDPKVLVLRILWSTHGSTSTETQVSGNNFASSTQMLLDGTSSSSPSFILTPTDATTTSASTTNSTQQSTTTSNSTQENSSSTSTVSVPSVDIDTKSTSSDSVPPQSILYNNNLLSFLKRYISVAYAQEDTTTQATDVTVTTSATTSLIDTLVSKVEDIITPATDTLPVSQPESSTTIATSTDTTSSATSTTDNASTTVSTSTDKLPPLFTIEYTLDGTTWIHLADVAQEELPASQFEIKVDNTVSWDDLSNLQIRIKRSTAVDTAPTIYLDAMSLEVELQDIQGKRKEQKITNIVNANDSFVGKASTQGDDVTLTVDASSTFGVALYDASGTLIYTSQVLQNENYFPVTSFPYGSYYLVATDDINWCANKVYDDCVATTTGTFRGQVSFQVVRPMY
jgi:hypothetical protein